MFYFVIYCLYYTNQSKAYTEAFLYVVKCIVLWCALTEMSRIFFKFATYSNNALHSKKFYENKHYHVPNFRRLGYEALKR